MKSVSYATYSSIPKCHRCHATQGGETLFPDFFFDGKSHEMTDDDWTKSGVVNASLNGLDSRNAYTHKPKVGFDGHIIIAKSGNWYETDNKGFLNNIRKSIVFHELAENYYRTVEGMNYNEAHDKATRREGFLFHRSFPGTVPPATQENPKDGFYYKIKP